MKKYNTICLLLMFVGLVQAQSNKSWGGYFSYNHISGITESNSKIIAGTENAIFFVDLNSNEIQTFNSIDGLKSEKITAIYHSETFNKTLVGNDNGLLLVIDNNQNKIFSKVDIINDVPVIPSIKKINHFTEHNGKAYIATDYGISVINLQTLEFEDTYFISESGQELKVIQTTIHNNQIYAVTHSPYGIRRASLSNPFLVNYQAWETVNSNHWNGIQILGNNLIASGNDGSLYIYQQSGNFIPFVYLGSTIISIKSYQGFLAATTNSKVFVFNENLVSVGQIGQIFDKPQVFTGASVVKNSVYIGTESSGIFAVPLNNLSSFVNYIPAGPLKNKVYSLKATNNNLWFVFGDNSTGYNPYFPDLGRYGVSKLSEDGWKHIPYDSLFNATNLSDIAIQPNNENIAFIGSNHSGILKIENNTPTILYNQTNTGQYGLEGWNSTITTDVRVHNLTFDKNGTLWATNAGGNSGKIKRFQGGNWSSYIVSQGESHFGDLVVDKNGTKWIATLNKGLIGFNESYDNRSITIDTYDKGLPYNHVLSVALDLNDRLWIGTLWGIRILPSVDRFFTEDQPAVNPVIIMEDGLAQELLYRQPISKIKVNGANQKWIGTLGAGVFLVSSSGQETIYHFTKSNSPLPSNQIIDIDINPITGEVFFATDKGTVSFKGTSTAASDNLSGVYVYPNPVRPEYSGTVKIAGLTDNANVKITDIEGNLVHEANSKGGTIEWDTTAFGRYRVASGVYMIFITTESAEETKVKKVMIIR